MANGYYLYYEDASVTITTMSVIFGIKTFSLSEISCATVEEINPNVIVIIFGYFSILVGFIGGAILASTSSGDASFMIAGLVTLLFVGIGISLISIPKRTYIIKIVTRSGVSEALKSNDYNYVKEIVQTINQAIAQPLY